MALDSDWRILFVHGIQPKPPREVHAEQLWRALAAGVRRNDPDLADALGPRLDAFELVYWADLLYSEHWDPQREDVALAAALARSEAGERHGGVLRTVRLWLQYAVHHLGDRYPALIPLLSTSRTVRNLAHARHYFQNQDGVGVRIRARLKEALSRAWSQDGRVLLIGHSLGSVIAWDTLWELTHREQASGRVDLLLTLGSPLGTRWVQQRLLGAGAQGANRYPWLIDRWVNVSAAGDMTAFKPALAGDFAAMSRLDLVQRIEERAGVKTWFLEEGRVNVHKSYAYLMHSDVGEIIANWLKERPTEEAGAVAGKASG